MSAMITEVYDALRSAGVDEDKAKSAASAMFNYDLATRGDILALDNRLTRIGKDVQFMKWCVSGIFVTLLADFVRGFPA